MRAIGQKGELASPDHMADHRTGAVSACQTVSPLINLSATVGTLQTVDVTVYTQVSDMIVMLISVILLSN